MVSFSLFITLSLCVASVMAAQQNVTVTNSTQTDDVLLSQSSEVIQVDSISKCPSFTPRTSPAKDVTDLRIDDIKLIGGLGDR